ncbi:MAG: YraN family protein [Thermaurantimonas sp.]|uniref:YraN family protein n=1 Tax=Thermaurantimonas sp. TaxID=2681568 RepID=UPI00391A0B3C
MATHLETGRGGEQLATEFLEQKGHQILERNWRWDKAEVDIISRDGDFLVFTEVKTRTGYPVPEAYETLDEYKIAHYADAAEAYLEWKDLDLEVRFDFIVVWLIPNCSPLIRHFPFAFNP